MAKDPAFLFYSQDFYTGVAILNWEERGKFISILCLMHQQGRMKEETIRFLVGSVSDNLKSKFQVDENAFWFNSRLEQESEKRAKFTESRRNNGLSGGRPTKDKPSAKPKNNLSVKHMDNHMEDENENRNVNEIRSIDKFKENFDNDYKTDDKVCRENDFSPQTLEKAKFEFWNTKELDSEMLGKSFQDVQKHFINWCRQNKSRLKETKNGKSTSPTIGRTNEDAIKKFIADNRI